MIDSKSYAQLVSMTDTKNSDGDGTVDRRKFVAGVGALGAAGVAGCIGDDNGGDGTPTSTPTSTSTDGDGDATPTPTPSPTPAEPQFGRGLKGLSYEFFEGEFDEMPNFDDLSATDSGDAEVITAELADGAGALRYTATLPVGSRLPAGEYEFHAGEDLTQDGRLVVRLGGNSLNFNSGSTPLYLSREIDVVVEYYQNSAGDQISFGMRGSYGELLPRVADTDPIRESRWDGEHYEVEVGRYPNSKRIQMPDSGSASSKRSLAVGLPSLRNFCFDANTGAVKYGWIGAFLDYGPMVAYGSGRGDSPGQPLGERFDVGGIAGEGGSPVEYPLRIGDAESEPSVEFLGYRETPHPPTLNYAVDGIEVTQAVRGVTDGIGLEYTFEFVESPGETVYFHTADDAPIERDSDAGTWNGGTLEVTDPGDSFTVTITATEVGQ